jgi:hypothetical protein
MYTPYMTLYLAISLQEIPYMVITNPTKRRTRDGTLMTSIAHEHLLCKANMCTKTWRHTSSRDLSVDVMIIHTHTHT